MIALATSLGVLGEKNMMPDLFHNLRAEEQGRRDAWASQLALFNLRATERNAGFGPPNNFTHARLFTSGPRGNYFDFV